MISRSLLREEDIISSQYSVLEYDHRSKIFIVEKGNVEGLLVKQIRDTKSPLPYLLQKDATTLWNIENEPVFNSLKSFTAKYLGFDVDHQALITEYNIGFINLEQYLIENDGIDRTLLSNMIQLLEMVNIPFSKLPKTPSFYFYPRAKPWIFEILSYDENNDLLLPHYAPISEAISGHYAFKEELEKARAEWRVETFIHGDIKWTNFIISAEGIAKDLKLIDWELADIGDPIWDVASLIHCIIKDGILNKGQTILDIFSDNDLSVAFDFISFIVTRYSEQKKSEGLEAPNVTKLMRYAMLRLVQSACELNDFDRQLKPVTLHVLNASGYMAEHLNDIASSVESKIAVK